MFTSPRVRGGRVVPVCSGAPDGGKQYTDDLEVDIQCDDVDRVEEVRLAKGKDDDNDVEYNREDEVEYRDPEEGL